MSEFIPSFDLTRDVLSLWSAGNIHDTAFTILMGALVAVACAWLGCWLILQGLALIGDAISHTVLLGIVLAVLLTGEIAGIGMFVAATITGLVTVVLIDTLNVSSRLKNDAAIGIVFSAMFALGVALLGTLGGGAHIDTGHVLYGNLEFVTSGPSVVLAGIDVPLPVCQMAVVVALLMLLIVAFYKELLLVAFDPQLAAAMGMRPVLCRYALLAALSLTVVGSFQAVGAVLVVAMLIAPAATAYMLTKRLPMMFVYSATAAMLAAVFGFHLSYWLDVGAASAMVCVACGFFGLVFLCAPEQGVLSAIWRRARGRLRASQENIIRRIWKLTSSIPEAAIASDEVATGMNLPGWQFAWSVRSLIQRGWIEAPAGAAKSLKLTARGALQAQRLDRAHRLWETYLVDKVGLPSDHVHSAAEEVEHVLSDQLVERLDDVLGHPETDPHGAPIPRSPVSDRNPGVFSLSKLRAGDTGRVEGLAAGDADGTLAISLSPDGITGVARLGLTLGQRIVVLDRAGSGQEWSVQLGTGGVIVVPHALADLVLVRLEPSASGNSEPQAP